MALRPLFRDIAAALREKEGSGEPIPARDFPQRIRALPSLPEDLRTIRLLPAPEAPQGQRPRRRRDQAQREEELPQLPAPLSRFGLFFHGITPFPG